MNKKHKVPGTDQWMERNVISKLKQTGCVYIFPRRAGLNTWLKQFTMDNKKSDMWTKVELQEPLDQFKQYKFNK